MDILGLIGLCVGELRVVMIAHPCYFASKIKLDKIKTVGALPARQGCSTNKTLNLKNKKAEMLVSVSDPASLSLH
jgi:hypothetical protein